MDEPIKLRATLENEGISGVLDQVVMEVTDRFRQRLVEACQRGYLDISEEQISTLVQSAARIARNAAANGIAQAYQMGVIQVRKESHEERPTERPPR